MTAARTRGQRKLGMGMRGRRIMGVKNRALIRGGGGGNTALLNIANPEGQRKKVYGPVVHQV